MDNIVIYFYIRFVDILSRVDSEINELHILPIKEREKDQVRFKFAYLRSQQWV